MTAELAKTIQELNEAHTEFKKANDENIAHVKKHGEQLSEHTAKIEKCDKAVEDALEKIKSIEKSMIEMQLPTGDSKKSSKAEQDHLKAFEDYFRSVKELEKYGNEDKRQALIEAQKAVSIGTASAGGHAVPEIISRQIEAKLLDVSEMLGLVNNITVGTSDYKELVDTKGMGYGWVGETQTRDETGTPNLEQVAPTMGIIYAYPKATEESLQDIFFDVQSWLVNSAVEAFDVGIGAAIIAGNGTNKPTGFLNGTPVATADDGASPERAFGTLQYIPTGTAGALPPAFNLQSSPQVSIPQGNFLYDVIYSLKKGYRRNARWLMNKNTLKDVRKFRDEDGQYLWQPGLQAGQPSMLAGYALNEMEDMPDVAADTFPIAFGDFRAAYTFVNRAGMSMTVDDNITTPGYIKFYMRKRVGGKLRNDDAIKLVKASAS